MQRLEELQCLFWSRHSPLQIVRWLANEGTLDDTVQQKLLDIVLKDDPLLSAYPLEDSYLRQLLKHLIDAVEGQHQDVNDELVELYSSLLMVDRTQQKKQGSRADQWSIKTFCWAQEANGLLDQLGRDRLQQHAERLKAAATDSDGGTGRELECNQKLTLSQQAEANRLVCKNTTNSNNTHSLKAALANQTDNSPAGLLSLRVSSNMLAGGTGCAEWEAGLVLAEVLLSHPQLVAGMSCIELGCGCGTVGIAAAAAGARELLLTDGSLETVNNCYYNCNVLNGIPTGRWATGTCPWGSACSAKLSTDAEPKVLCGLLQWENADDQLAGWQPQVVLGADLLYDPVAIPYLVDLMQQLCCAGKQNPHTCNQRDEEVLRCWPYANTCQHAAIANEQQTLTESDGRFEANGKKSAQSQEGTVVYLATTRRNEATLQLFLSTIAASRLECEDVTGLLVTSHTVSDSCKMCRMVHFQRLPWLEEARPRVLLHRIRKYRQ